MGVGEKWKANLAAATKSKDDDIGQQWKLAADLVFSRKSSFAILSCHRHTSKGATHACICDQSEDPSSWPALVKLFPLV